MTVLGEAFIEVRGDLKPFIRDLDKQVKKALKTFEKDIKAGLSDSLKVSNSDTEKLGDDIGDGVGRGIRRKVGDKNKSPWINIAAALGSALDDGLSALPAEVKAAIVIGIIASVPLVSAALAGATAAGLGFGVAGIGVALSSQFTQVQEAAAATGNTMREVLTRAAEPFAGAVVTALNEISEFFVDNEQLFSSIFDTASNFVGPITKSLLESLESFAVGVDGMGDKLGPFVEELADGIYTLISAVTQALEIIVNTGEEGQEGFRDMVYAIGSLIVGTARAVALFTELYGVLRDIVQIAPVLNPLAAIFFDASDKATQQTLKWSRAELELAQAIKGTLAPTKEQEKATLAAAKAMDAARDAAFSLVDAEIDYQQSLDDLTVSIKENGRTLAFETEEGRKNLRNLGDAIKAAQRVAEERYLAGKLTAEQATALYQQEIDQILKIARSLGINEAAIRKVYDESIKLVNLPTPKTGWLGNLADAATKAAEQLERARRAAQGLSGTGKGSGGFTGFAEGGIATEPTLATIAEGGRPEVVIPLTKPARAAQLAQQSGLTQMLGGGVTLVQVYIGPEQLEQRMYRVVQDSNNSLTNTVAFGARGL